MYAAVLHDIGALLGGEVSMMEVDFEKHENHTGIGFDLFAGLPILPSRRNLSGSITIPGVLRKHGRRRVGTFGYPATRSISPIISTACT